MCTDIPFVVVCATHSATNSLTRSRGENTHKMQDFFHFCQPEKGCEAKSASKTPAPNHTHGTTNVAFEVSSYFYHFIHIVFVFWFCIFYALI